MLAFIDESGDSGFKLGRGSSDYFVLSCVIFVDELEAEKCAVAIKQLKRDLHFPDSVEFKFNKARRDVRIKFLTLVSGFDFRCRLLVVKKSLLRSPELTRDKNSFYSYFIKLLLQHNNDSIQDAKVRIDGHGDREFRQSFMTYLRKQLNSDEREIMKNCKLVDSKSNVLIQLADMVAGSVHASYIVGRTDRILYKQIIQRHVQDEWQFK